MRKIKVYINSIEGNRKMVEAEVVRENPSSFVVRLPDGNEIKRKKDRDIVKEVDSGQTNNREGK